MEQIDFFAVGDIVIDAFRIESLTPEQLGVGSGMSQYGWRIGASYTVDVVTTASPDIIATATRRFDDGVTCITAAL